MRFRLEEFLRSKIHVSRKTEAGEIVCECPDCARPDKLWVNAHTGFWICYRCGKAGRLISLVSWLEGVSFSVARTIVVAGSGAKPAASVLNDMADVDIESEDGSVESHPQPARLPVQLPAEFVPVFDAQARVRHWPKYLDERGVSVRTAVVYGLGVCHSGDYGGRIIVPVRLGGVLRTFTARAVAADAHPKYKHPPGDEKSSWLFGLDEAVGADEVVFVEGPFDVFGVVRAGLMAVGLLGKRMTLTQQNYVTRAGFRKITVLLDPDAGPECREVERQLALTCETVVRGRLPAGVDPGSAMRGQVLEAVAEAR